MNVYEVYLQTGPDNLKDPNDWWLAPLLVSSVVAQSICHRSSIHRWAAEHLSLHADSAVRNWEGQEVGSVLKVTGWY